MELVSIQEIIKHIPKKGNHFAIIQITKNDKSKIIYKTGNWFNKNEINEGIKIVSSTMKEKEILDLYRKYKIKKLLEKK